MTIFGKKAKKMFFFLSNVLIMSKETNCKLLKNYFHPSKRLVTVVLYGLSAMDQATGGVTSVRDEPNKDNRTKRNAKES